MANIQCAECKLYFDDICKDSESFTFKNGEYRNPELITLINSWFESKVPGNPFQISIHIYDCRNFQKYQTAREEKYEAKKSLSDLDILMDKVKKMGTPEELPFTDEEKSLMSSLGFSL